MFRNTEEFSTKEDIAKAKEHFETFKTKFRSTRTSFFWLEEIINKGYLNLYYHLIDMQNLDNRNERKAAAEKMDFELACKIILEVRDALIQKVTENIPDFLAADILFLLGASGAGKSTAFCALKGDTIEIDDIYYQSKESPELIEKSAISGSLLPTISIVDHNRYIVDFPGFADSNGYLIQLGIHCALKALLNKYTPKIFILNSITDTQGRYAAPAQLGNLLGRLLQPENKKSKSYKEICTLAITKYMEDPHYIKMNELKKKLEKQKKIFFSNELAVFHIQIEALMKLVGEDDNHPLWKDIEEINEKIINFQNCNKQIENPIQLQLEEDIKKYQEKIHEKENQLKGQIGVERMVPLVNLEDPKQIEKYLKIFYEYPNSTGFSQIFEMDPEHTKLLTILFEKHIKANSFDLDAKLINSKEELLNLLYQKSLIHGTQIPIISGFLHQTVIDSDLVKSFDVMIVEDCIRQYTRFILRLNIPHIKKLLAEKAQQTDKVEQLIKSLTELEKNMILILGFGDSENLSAQEQWEERNKEFNAANPFKEEPLFTLPKWIDTITFLAFGKELREKPLTLKKLVSNLQKNESILRQPAGEDLEACIEESNKLCHLAKEFDELKKVVQKEASEERRKIVKLLKKSDLPNDLEIKIGRLVREVSDELKKRIVSLLEDIIVQKELKTLTARIMEIMHVNALTALITIIEEESAEKALFLFSQQEKIIYPIIESDITFADNFIRQYTDWISNYQIPSIKKLLKEKVQGTDKVEQLIKLLSELEVEMIQLLGFTDTDKQSAKEEWKSYNNNWQEENEKLKYKNDQLQETCTLPVLLDTLMYPFIEEGREKPQPLKKLVGTIEKTYSYSLKLLDADELDKTMTEVSKMRALAKEVNELKKGLKKILHEKIAGIEALCKKAGLDNEFSTKIISVLNDVQDEAKIKIVTLLEEWVGQEKGSNALAARITKAKKLNELKTLIDSLDKTSTQLSEKQLTHNHSTFFAYSPKIDISHDIYIPCKYNR